MKFSLVSMALLVALPLCAAAETTNESRFHLLSMKCEAEDSSGPEATPQSPPLNVDDPSTPGCNRWEINVVMDGDFTRTQNNWEMPLLDINFGVGDNIQLKYEVPYANNTSEGTHVSAIGESRAGIKYMFFEDDQSKLQLAAYPQLTFVGTQSDAVIKGLASPGTIITLPLLLATEIGKTRLGAISLTANLGYNISGKADTADFIHASVGIGTPIGNAVALMGEITTEQAMRKIADEGRAQLIRTDLGVMTTISKNFLLFGAVGHSIYSSDPQGHAYGLAGFRVLTGGTAPQEKVASR